MLTSNKEIKLFFFLNERINVVPPSEAYLDTNNFFP